MADTLSQRLAATGLVPPWVERDAGGSYWDTAAGAMWVPDDDYQYALWLLWYGYLDFREVAGLAWPELLEGIVCKALYNLNKRS